jgi:hypothetical protein
MKNEVSIEFLAEMWREQKRAELGAQTRRREIEDEIARRAGKAVDYQGREKVEGLEISWSLTESLDRDALLATGLDHETLSTFVRWRPELNKAAYKTAPEGVRIKIEGAITRKPGRPSFSEIKKGDK